MGEVKHYTRAQVAEKNGKKGAPAWIIIKDSIYDVTYYVKEHPGGETILDEAGSDATKVFEGIGHSSDAKSLLARLRVGEIVEEEKWYDANGKKKKKVKVENSEEEIKSGSILSLCTCGFL